MKSWAVDLVLQYVVNKQEKLSNALVLTTGGYKEMWSIVPDPIVPLFMSPNAGGGEFRGLSMDSANEYSCTQEPK